MSDCEFYGAADRTLRCMPVRSGLANARVFSDNGCTHRIAGQFSTAVPVPYAVYDDRPPSDPPCNGPPLHIAPLGAQISPPQAFVGVPGNCEPSTSGFDEFFEIGPEIDPSTFVSATISNDDAPDRLESQVRHAADGSLEWLSYYDSKKTVACYPSITTDGIEHCVPTATFQLTSDFMNVACSTPATVSNQFAVECGVATPFAFVQSPAYPNQSYRFFNVGTPAKTMTIYGPGSSTDCDPLVAETYGYQYAPLGSEILPAELAMLGRAEAAIAARVRPIVFDPVGEGRASTEVEWRDTELDVDCTWQIAADGAERCLPDAEFGQLFIDDQCTQYAYCGSTSIPGTAAFLESADDGLANHLYRPVSPAIPEAQIIYGLFDDEADGGATPDGGIECRARTLRPAPECFAVSELPPSTFEAAHPIVE